MDYEKNNHIKNIVRKRLFIQLLLIIFFTGLIVSIVSGTTIFVAANDSSAESKLLAQYQCDGTNDHLEIQQALNTLGNSGGEVILLEGTFNCPGILTPPTKSKLIGQGDTRTFLKFSNNGRIRITKDNIALDGFHVTGEGYSGEDVWESPIYIINANHIQVRNITATADNTPNAVFFIVSSKDTIIEDIEFSNCKAIDPGTYGFLLTSASPNVKLMRNIRFIDCEAINCGRFSRFDNWVVGFDFAERNDIENLTVIRCLAEGNWESGFHVEYNQRITDMKMIDCVSKNNCQKGWNEPTASYGSGYLIHGEILLKNCTSEKNLIGYNIMYGGCTLIDCTDTGSKIGFYVRNINQSVIITSSSTLGETYPIYLEENDTTYGPFFVNDGPLSIDRVNVDKPTITNPNISPLIYNYVVIPSVVILKNSIISGYSFDARFLHLYEFFLINKEEFISICEYII